MFGHLSAPEAELLRRRSNNILAALFCRICNCSIKRELFLSAQIRSPLSNNGKIKELYSIILALKVKRDFTLEMTSIL